MGELALHAERLEGAWSYVGALVRPKHYGLFHVLGAPGFAKYGVLPDGTQAAQLATTAGLPGDASAWLREIASQRPRGEASWRHASRDALVAYPWRSIQPTRYLAGPVGFASYRKGQHASRWIDDTPQTRAYMEQIGARVISHAEMSELIDADGGRVLRDDPDEHNARVIVELDWKESLASVFDFQPALDWLRDLGPDPIRIALWIEA